MERRELLKMLATSVGASVALPESVFARMGEPFDPAELTFFSPAQKAQVAMIAEAIIPRTDTPGAIDAGVPGWIEVIVKDCLQPEDQQVIVDGLADLMRHCQKEHGTSIDKLKGPDQVAFLTKFQNHNRSEARKAAENGGTRRQPFIDRFKELTKVCFCSSEVGATEIFEYHLVPGKWVASMPLKPGQKAWAM
jgi:hypothetical protein